MDKTHKQLIEDEVDALLAVQQGLSEYEQLIMADERFRTFIEKQRAVTDQINETWKSVEQEMIEHNIKSIKGDWGSLTITERTSFDVDMAVLPDKFKKTVADTKRIGDTFKLEGESPEGTTPKYSKFLTKRLKG